MKMSNFEKKFVNSPSHSRQVSAHAERLVGLIEPEVGQTYLDVGCGNGAAPLHVAQRFGLAVTGIDVDPDQVRAAERLASGAANARFLTVDGTDLPFEDDEFDIVSTNKVMHHIPNWPDALAEMVRVLKPEGYLIYADIVVPAWLATVGQRLVRHLVGFPTVKRLDDVVSTCGLTPVHLAKSPLHYEGVFQKA